MPKIEAVQGDITEQRVDAIVNAARQLGGCPTGEARLTQGYRLPARYVIHTVGPVWSGGKRREPALLRGCYRNSLELARAHAITSIAFPSISTGAYRYPIEQAAAIAVEAVRRALAQPTTIALVRFVCFSAGDLEVYRKMVE